MSIDAEISLPDKKMKEMSEVPKGKTQLFLSKKLFLPLCTALSSYCRNPFSLSVNGGYVNGFQVLAG